MTQFLRLVDRFINPLVWLSIILLFVEFFLGSDNSLDSKMWIFLWIERVTASIFCVEYFVRMYEDKKCPTGHYDIGPSYARSVMGVIDLLAWLPFVVGFFVPVQFLGWIRALRVLRLFKLFRYHRTLQLFALAIYRGWWILKSILFVSLCTGLFAAAMVFEAEKKAQPEKFGEIGNVFYFIATADSTVGFGDYYPITPIGKFLTVLLVYLPGIAVFGSIMGIIGTSFTDIMHAEKDPYRDPIEDFHKERQLC